MLALAAVLAAIAVIIDRGNPGSADLPVAIQEVSPVAGSNVLSQTEVSVDLAVGYTAELEINGIVIPEDELFRVEALNQLTYRPREGRVIDQLRADQNCVRVQYWLISEGRSEADPRFDWCFDAS